MSVATNKSYQVACVGELIELLSKLPDDTQIEQINPAGVGGPLVVFIADDGGVPLVQIYEG